MPRRLGMVRQSPPQIFALYVTGYSGIPHLRGVVETDPANHILGMRLNFFVACLLTITGAIWFAMTQGGSKVESETVRHLTSGVRLVLAACLVRNRRFIGAPWNSHSSSCYYGL